MKKYYIKSKFIFQMFLYLFEVIGASLLITLSFNYIFPIQSKVQFIDRMISFYTLYQILVLVILTNKNDIYKDSYLAYITTLKLCLIYSESKDINLKHNIINNINKQLDFGVLNTITIRKNYDDLKINLDNYKKEYIQQLIIYSEHEYESFSLNWRYSFILSLKIFK